MTKRLDWIGVATMAVAAGGYVAVLIFAPDYETQYLAACALLGLTVDKGAIRLWGGE